MSGIVPAATEACRNERREEWVAVIMKTLFLVDSTVTDCGIFLSLAGTAGLLPLL
jgi:hypothetical protein